MVVGSTIVRFGHALIPTGSSTVFVGPFPEPVILGEDLFHEPADEVDGASAFGIAWVLRGAEPSPRTPGCAAGKAGRIRAGVETSGAGAPKF